MTTQSLALTLSPEIGNISAEYTMPHNCSCIMVLAHGAGAGMHHSFMVTMSKALAETGIATLRFNFPFMEKKTPRPDLPAIAHLAIAAAISKAAELFPSLPLFVAGKSLGEEWVRNIWRSIMIVQ